MNIIFPKEHSKLLDKYNTSKEFNKNKSFLLDMDKIPDLIYSIDKKKNWILAEGKNGLYELIDSNDQLSLNEIYHKLENVSYDFIIGYLKEEQKFLAKHPISGKMTEWTPEEAYQICKKLNKKIPELEPTIAKDAYTAYFYANFPNKGRFPLGEPAIATNAEYSFEYAKDIIKGRFPLGEPVISKNYRYAVQYARDVIKGRWEPGEAAIAENNYSSLEYAVEVIKGRFPLGEPVITNSQNQTWEYMKKFNLKIVFEENT